VVAEAGVSVLHAVRVVLEVLVTAAEEVRDGRSSVFKRTDHNAVVEEARMCMVGEAGVRALKRLPSAGGARDRSRRGERECMPAEIDGLSRCAVCTL